MNHSAFMVVAISAIIAVTTTLTVQLAFAAGGGTCSNCASSFTPSALSSGLSGTGAHGMEKIFAPGQEAQVSGASASDFAPGQVKP